MSLVYLLSKFSQEAIMIELLLLGLFGTSYFGYLLFKKRKYGVARKQIPDHVVRAFLVDLMSRTEGFKNQLFGENFRIPTHPVSSEPMMLHTSSDTPHASASAAKSTDSGAGKVDDAALQKLKAELQAALGKQDEMGKALSRIQDEKAQLENKLAQAGSAAPAAAAAEPAADLKDAHDKITKLEAKLSEYEVIEDDLANLKRYQQENKQLKAQLAAQQNSPAQTPAGAPPPLPAEAALEEPIAEAEAATDAASPEASPLAAAEEVAATTSAEKELAGFAGKVEESLNDAPAEPPVGASINDPFAIPAKPSAETAAAEPAVGGEKPADKSDADLLSEFEKMLSS